MRDRLRKEAIIVGMTLSLYQREAVNALQDFTVNPSNENLSAFITAAAELRAHERLREILIQLLDE